MLKKISIVYYFSSWTRFYSNINKSPKELGLDLGVFSCLAIRDTPFGLFYSNYFDLGQAYIVITDDESTIIKVKNPNDIIGITQIVAFIDTTMATDEEGLSVPLFAGFIVGNTVYYSLTVEAVAAIKLNQRVEFIFNTPYFTINRMRCQQILFYKENEEPVFGEDYIQKCHNIQIRFGKESVSKSGRRIKRNINKCSVNKQVEKKIPIITDYIIYRAKQIFWAIFFWSLFLIVIGTILYVFFSFLYLWWDYSTYSRFMT
jgi:hypothetical protein